MRPLRYSFIAFSLTLLAVFAPISLAEAAVDTLKSFEPHPHWAKCPPSVVAISHNAALPQQSKTDLALIAVDWDSAMLTDAQLSLRRTGEAVAAAADPGEGDEEDDPLGRFKPDHPIDEGID